MGSDLENWITPVALEELSSAHDIFEGEYQPGETLQRNGRSYSSGVVTIPLIHRRLVQILDFNGRHRHPFDVTVSDGNTKIRATFSKQCTTEFSKRHDRKFSDRTAGGIIHIDAYNLIFKPESTPSKSLTLDVSKFSLVGSVGSSPFGHPLAVDKCPDLRAAIEKLQSLVRDNRGQGSSQIGLPSFSQSNTFSAGRQQLSPPPGTSATFATQVSTGAYDRQRITRSNHDPRPQKSQDHLSPKEEASHQKGARSDNDDLLLLGLLQSKGEGKTLETTGTSAPSVKAVPRLEEVVNSASGEGLCITSTKDLQQDQPATSPAGDSEKENSQESARLGDPQALKTRLSLTANNDTSALPQVLTFDDAADGDLFDGLKRVPRSYVRVHENQRAILQRNGSWFRWGYNDGTSYRSNVSSDILNGLAVFASRNEGQNVVEPGQVTASIHDPDDIHEDRHVGDSDLDDSPGSQSPAESGRPQSSPIRTNDPAEGLKAGTTTEDSRLDQTTSSPHEQTDNADEAEDEEPDDADERSIISWPQSPDYKERRDEASLPSLHPEMPSTLEDAEMDIDEIGLPQIPVERVLFTPGPLKGLKPGPDLPSSSPCDEDEFEVELAHAVDDPVDEQHDHAEEHTIQVKQTPGVYGQRFAEPADSQGVARGMKRRHDDISSDSVIPASASDGGPHGYLQSSGTGESKSQSTVHSKEADGNEPQVLTTQVSTGTDSTASSVLRNVRFIEGQATRLSIGSPIKSTYDLQGDSGDSQMATPTTYQVPEPPTSSLLLPHPNLKRLRENLERQFTTEFSQADYAPKESATVDSDSRRDFKAQLAVGEAMGGTSAKVLETEAATPSTSQAPADASQREKGQTMQQSNSSNEQPGDDGSEPVEDTVQPSHPPTSFDKFLSTYPSYKGNEAHFINGLVYIEWLVSNRGTGFLRKSLWDDLIRVLADEYMEYAMRPHAGGKKMKGLEFYNELDQDPVFKQQVITPSTLQDAISTVEPEEVDVVRRIYKLPRASKSTTDPSRASTIEEDVQAIAATPLPTQEGHAHAIHTQSTISEPPSSAMELDDEPDLYTASPEKVTEQQPGPSSMDRRTPLGEGHADAIVIEDTISEQQSSVADPDQEPGQEPASLEVPAQPVPSSTDRRKMKPRFFETRSQFPADDPIRSSNIPDATPENIETSSAKRVKAGRRSLPWGHEADTAETRSGPSSPHASRPSGLVSESPKSTLRSEKDNSSGPALAVDADADEDDDLPAPKSASRKTQSLPNPPTGKKLRQIGLDHVSEAELAFLRDFARRRMRGKRRE